MYIAKISLDVTLYYKKPNQTEPNLERISEDNTDHYVICVVLLHVRFLTNQTKKVIPWAKKYENLGCTEALEGHFSYYLQLICYSLIVITYLLMLT